MDSIQNAVAEIQLNQGKIALVEREDFEWLNQWKWSIGVNGYAVRTDKNNKGIYLHRLIMGFPKGKVDHINRNKLDNRYENLRVVTAKENSINIGKFKNKSSIYKGVSWDKRRNDWIAYLSEKGKKVHIGYFPKEQWAAMARDMWAKELYGKYAVLNFNP